MINLYYGPVVNPKTLKHFDALPRCLIAVGLNGNIMWIEDDVEKSALHHTIALHGLKDGEYMLRNYTDKPCEFIMPGLIDCHVHACQFPNLGVGGDRQLLDWLFEYVFPTEAKFEDLQYAESAYNEVIARSIASGTTTSCYYGSLHLPATKRLAEIACEKGQRAFIGKCNMDWNCPGYYIERTPEDSLRDTLALIEHIKSLPLSPANEPLVQPIITPRFALSCSDKLLTQLGALAAQHPHLPIQTHISENRREVEDVKRRFDAESYAGVYDQFGLLRENTVLGHGVWLTEDEMALIKARGAGVAHCPTSNFYLSSGMARVGLMLDYGVKVGLGTDVGGGYNPSILYAIQMASTASKMVAVQADLDKERRARRRAARKCCRHCKPRKHACGCCDVFDSDSDATQEQEQEAEERAPRGHCNGHGHCHSEHGHGHCNCVNPRFANRKLDTPTLLYLATLGGADVLSLGARVGSFEPGKAFDALSVSLSDACGNPGVWGAMVDEVERQPKEGNVRRWLERFLFTGDGRNIRRVWVQGVFVGGAERDAGVRGAVSASGAGAVAAVDAPGESRDGTAARVASDEREGWVF